MTSQPPASAKQTIPTIIGWHANGLPIVAMMKTDEARAAARRRRQREARRVRADVYRSLGMVRNRDGSWE